MAYLYRTAQSSLLKISFFFQVIMITSLIIDPLIAQEISAQETKKPPTQLSEKEWKAIEGIFQDPGNNERNVQFTPKDHMLLAKLLWNNNEIQFLPESALGFVSVQPVEGQLLHIEFQKDSTGTVSQVKLPNIGVWNRTKNYMQIVKKEIDHTPEQLRPFEGLYQLKNSEDQFIQFFVKGNMLVLKQHWDGNEISFVPETFADFFCKENPLFSLTFTKENDGNISQVLAFKRDIWLRVKKSYPSTGQLKIYEGKYQSRDDPDNFIQLIAKGKGLIVKQLWDGKETMVDPLTETYFYNKDQSYPLQMVKDKEGTITQVLILGIDLFNKMKG